MIVCRLSYARRARRDSRAVLFVALCSAVACGDGRPEAEDTSRSTVQVSDSAGVTNIALGRVEDLSIPDLETRLVFSTRELGIELFYVGDAVLLGDGGVALANTGASEVLIFSGDGSLSTRIGGQGEGPGEFSAITTLIGTPQGFVAYDARLARLTEFSASGEFLDSRPLSAQSAIVDLRPLAIAADGSMLAILGEQRFFMPEGTKRDTTPLLAFADPGTEPDTLAMLPATEWSYGEIPGGGVTRREPGFGRDIVAGGFRDRAILGDTELFELSIHTAAGRLTRRIRGSAGGWPVTADEIETSRAARLARRGPDAPDWYVEFVENAPFRETHPAFHSAVLGPEELVWIGLATRPAEETRDWLVIGPDGQPRGRLNLPADASVLAVDADRFVVLQRDALDEEEVRLYRYR
ncbi:6-bladed beta-propeller [Candidatus Palauibacter sp.]|uniref:6-bladed beta-propeller n=1 Tax=Candidatus Palauibacter sp. TaxID=3101350 RepID=UPI003B02688C